MRVAFPVFGCKLNQSESEALASAFRSQGFFIVSPFEDADLYIVNTCAVTSKSEQKARRIMRKLSREHEHAVLIITGCYAQLERESLQNLVPRGVILPHEEKDMLLDLPGFLAQSQPPYSSRGILSFLSENDRNTPRDQRVFRFRNDEYSYHSRCFVKIQDGCDNRCSYCIVPLARGNSVSRSLREIVDEVRVLEEKGYGEIVLTGVNISSYRHEEHSLASLLDTLLTESRNVRFRLSSLEPEMFSDHLFALFQSDRVCPHIHLPVQSGSDRVLKLMRRKYTSKTVRSVIHRLRNCLDDPFIAGDVIVGFPGEGEEDFVQTADLVRDCDITRLHVFQFSTRPGTSAEGMPGKVPEITAKNRSRILRQMSEEQLRRYRSRWINRRAEVVLEEQKQFQNRLFYTGLTENYLKVKCTDGVPQSARPGMVYHGVILGIDDDMCSFSCSSVF